MWSDPEEIGYAVQRRPWWRKPIWIVTGIAIVLGASCAGWILWTALFTDWLPNQK
jgi:hypothetical protein